MTRLSIRKLVETGVAPLGNLVKGDAYQRIVAAETVLAEAEAEGRRAYEAAVARGREEGETEGRNARAALIAETLAEARSYLRGAEERLIGIVGEAVQRVLGEFDDAELVSLMVGQLIRDAEGEGKIRLHVSPRQCAVVRERVGELQSASAGVQTIEVIADADVEDGGCRMETELGFVSTSIEEQVETLRTALEKYPLE